MQILLFVSFIIIIIMICTKISVNLIEHFVMANLTKIKKTIHKNGLFPNIVMNLMSIGISYKDLCWQPIDWPIFVLCFASLDMKLAPVWK